MPLIRGETKKVTSAWQKDKRGRERMHGGCRQEDISFFLTRGGRRGVLPESSRRRARRTAGAVQLAPQRRHLVGPPLQRALRHLLGPGQGGGVGLGLEG
jgi:hypothetical protein